MPTPVRSRAVTALALAAIGAATFASAGCGDSEQDAPDSPTGPSRMTPTPDDALAHSMTTARASTDLKLDACKLAGLTTARVATLVGVTLPDAPPVGGGERSSVCTYGGPGSDAPPATPASSTDESTAADAATTDENGDPVTTSAPAATASTPSASGTTSSTSPATTTPDAAATPDTVTIGVVAPGSDVKAALAAQPDQLAGLYTCSALRGPGAPAATAPPRPGAPFAANPDLKSQYVDCVATPNGGGTEVHTIVAAGSRLWHLAVTRPGTARSPQSEATALAGLHKLALQVAK